MPRELAWLSIRPRPSTIRMNKKGESGSPCRMPREGLKVFEGALFMRTKKKAEEIRLRIQ